ncbi:MAG: glycoside hydrolase [Planctomycetes bacterium]|nr:glycoside hydrolase [Planctomycetota bacterium]
MKAKPIHLLFAAVAPLLAAEASAADPFETTVFTSGEGGYHTYRIPALLVSPKGTLLAFCEGRKTGRGDHGDLDLVLRRSRDGGDTWQPMQLVYEEGGDAKITIGNPCPVVDGRRIWLPFCRDNDDVFITYSDDDGQTWAAPREITGDVKRPDWGWYATGPGVGIQLQRGPHKGRLVIPCDHRRRIDGQDVTHSHVFFSDDHGATWQLGGTVAPHTNECQLVELADGSLLINMRNYWGREGGDASRDKMRAVALSRDGGETWQELRFDETLIEPICQASLVSLPPASENAKPLLLFSNPSSKTTRHRLTVRRSSDEGRTWPRSGLLHAGPAAYSSLAALPDGSIGCLYEGGEKDAYERLIFARFPLEWLKDAEQR